jgi:hypothetical protein
MRTTFSTRNGGEKYHVTSNLRRNHFSHLSELKIMVRLEFKVLYFTLRKFRKHNFPRRTSDLAKTAVNFTGSEMDLLPKAIDSLKKFLNAKQLMPYHNKLIQNIFTPL